MERTNISDVWLEAQIDENGIALTHISEGVGEDAIVEAVDHYTFDELQDKSGDMFNMNLSDDSRETLSEMRRLSNIGRVCVEAGDDESDSQESDNSQQSASADIQVGTVVRDTRPPNWAESDRMQVVNFSDKRAGQYVVEDSALFEKTVYDVNSPCEPNEMVVECVHPDGRGNFPDDPNETDIYAFPVSRVEPVER